MEYIGAVMDDNDLSAVARRTARSGAVDYSDPVVLHDSSKQRITLVPFYIHHNTSAGDVAAKIIREDKINSIETSITVQDAAARRLYRALGTAYAVSEQGGDGNFIVIPVKGEVADLQASEAAAVAGALAHLLGDDKVVEQLVTEDLGADLVGALQGTVRLRELRQAVLELASYLDAGESDESRYQDWCERHSWAFGNAYVNRDDNRTISASDSVDLLMPSVLGGFRDIIELKRPDVSVLLFDKDRRSYYLSSEVSRAIGQCHRYLDVLHEDAKNGLRDGQKSQHTILGQQW